MSRYPDEDTRRFDQQFAREPGEMGDAERNRLKKRIATLERELLERDQQVLDLCARLDLSGESSNLRDEQGALDYFTTVSMNIGCARVVIERARGTEYYAARRAIYEAEDAEHRARRPMRPGQP